MIDFPDINPIIVSYGSLAISWYSLSYIVGILLGWVYSLKLIENGATTITKKNIDDYITWAVVGVIVGGRLGYVVFYAPIKYFSYPISILKTYEGGMSFHGGMIGFIIAALWFTKRNKISFLNLMDLSVMCVPIALFLGRLANFINAELYGRPTAMPWAFIFPGSDSVSRHPSQLYEAFLEGIVLFCILSILAFKFDYLKKKGVLSGLFLIFYSTFRIIVEFYRQPDIHIGLFAEIFTMGQILCIPMLLIGIYLIYYSNKKC